MYNPSWKNRYTLNFFFCLVYFGKSHAPIVILIKCDTVILIKCGEGFPPIPVSWARSSTSLIVPPDTSAHARV